MEPRRSCPNCGSSHVDRFCAACGQPARVRDLTLRGFLRETTHELSNWDGKVPATLRALFLSPGRLTSDFLAGRRARWLAPLRVYLICSVAFFASKPVLEAVTGRTPRQMARVTLDTGRPAGPLTEEERRQIAEGLPGRVLGVDRLERAAADGGVRLNREIDAAFPRAMFVLLPVFALLTRLVWRRALAGYPAHLYAALHVHAAWFGALTLFSIGVSVVPNVAVGSLLGFAFLIYAVWYALAANRTAFGESWPRTILKTILVGSIYLGCLSVVALALLALVVSRM